MGKWAGSRSHGGSSDACGRCGPRTSAQRRVLHPLFALMCHPGLYCGGSAQGAPARSCLRARAQCGGKLPCVGCPPAMPAPRPPCPHLHTLLHMHQWTRGLGRACRPCTSGCTCGTVRPAAMHVKEGLAAAAARAQAWPGGGVCAVGGAAPTHWAAPGPAHGQGVSLDCMLLCRRNPQVLPMAVRALPAAEHECVGNGRPANHRLPVPGHERHHPQLVSGL